MTSNNLPTKWTLCALCQDGSENDLRDPFKSTRKSDVRTEENGRKRMKGYETLAKNIVRLQKLNELPLSIDLARLNDGTGIENTMIINHAKYHDHCYKLFDNRVVERAEKKHNVSTTPVKKKLRLSTPRRKEKIPKCYFYNEEFSNDDTEERRKMRPSLFMKMLN